MLFLLHVFVIYSSWSLLLYFSSSFVSSLSHLCFPVSSVADGPTISCRKEQSYNIQRLKWESTAACLYCSCCIFFMWLFFFFVIFGLKKQHNLLFFYFFPIWTSLKPLTHMEIMLGVLLTSLTLYLLWGGRLIVGVICIIVGSLPRRVFCCGLTLYKSNWIGIILTAVLVWANMLNCYF